MTTVLLALLVAIVAWILSLIPAVLSAIFGMVVYSVPKYMYTVSGQVGEGLILTAVSLIFDPIAVLEAFKVLGIAIASFVFIFNLLVCFVSGGLGEIRDSLFKMVLRYTISLILINSVTSGFDYYSNSHLKGFLGMINSFVGNESLNLRNKLIGAIKADALLSLEEMPTTSSFTGTLGEIAEALGLNPIVELLRIIFGFACIKGAVSIIVERVKRGLTYSILCVTSPFFLAFYASPMTSSVTSLYVKTLATQGFIVMSTDFFISIMQKLWTVVNNYNLGGIILLYAYIQLGLGIERTLKDFGLTALSPAPALYEGASAAASRAIMTFNQARQLTKGVTTGIGSGAKALGARNGSANLMQAGSILSGRGRMSIGEMLGEHVKALNSGAKLNDKMTNTMAQVLGTNGGSMMLNRTLAEIANPKTRNQAFERAFDKTYGGSLGKMGISVEKGSLNFDKGGAITGRAMRNGQLLGDFRIGRESGIQGMDVAMSDLSGGNYGQLEFTKANSIPSTISNEVGQSGSLEIANGFYHGNIESKFPTLTNENAFFEQSDLGRGYYDIYEKQEDGSALKLGTVNMNDSSNTEVYYSAPAISDDSMTSFRDAFKGDGVYSNLGIENVGEIKVQEGGIGWVFEAEVNGVKKECAYTFYDQNLEGVHGKKYTGTPQIGSGVFSFKEIKKDEDQKKA